MFATPTHPAPHVVEALRAMPATAVPTQERGLWYIQRTDLSAVDNPLLRRVHLMRGAYDRYPLPPVMTSLCRWTDATIHRGAGEAVMSDDPAELVRHLPILLAAHGRVLVSGLGLGCVVRGLLANPRVERIDVVEIDADILAMVVPSFDAEPRVVWHHGDARRFRWPPGARWDFAWHDVWGERPSTQVLHLQLLARYRTRVRRQGAWMLPRWVAKRWPEPLLGASRDRRPWPTRWRRPPGAAPDVARSARPAAASRRPSRLPP